VTMISVALALKNADHLLQVMTLPLIVGGVCILTSIVGTFFVRLGSSGSIMGALYKGFWVSVGLSIPAIYFATQYTLGDMNTPLGGNAFLGDVGAFTGMKLFGAMMIGLAVTGLLVWITEYYTGTNFRPVRSIAKASETGHGTNVIQGLAISLESTALPTLVIVIAVIAAYQLAGVIGIAFAAT
uniref:sodium/proton-translocating pyrophosphatase n=1 Tax=Pseudomonas sp. EA_65y_Pfl1_P113 TaxID=3088692 RepID=UPI0030DD20FE